ncbi:MAG: SDR family oxidoreductase [Methyloprofundus sp.]|nr:SDR family oxidoreductase [Methyloprofundus sp.]
MSDPRIDPNDPALQPLQINTEPLKGKKVLITGIANKDSIAYGAARAFKAFGADIAMTYLNDKTRNFTQQLAEALAVDPAYVPARLDLAVIQTQLGDMTSAEDNFRRAVEDNPYFARGIYNLGAFLVQRGELENAKAYFNRALTLAPDYHLARYAVIESLLRSGHRDDAGKHYDQLLLLAPNLALTLKAKELFQQL